MVGRLALTMPMEFSTMAQIMGSTSAPVIVKLEVWNGVKHDGKGKVGTYRLRLDGKGV